MEKFFRVRRNSLLLIVNKNFSKNSERGIALLLSLLISMIMAFALSIELLNTQLNKKSFALNLQHDVLFYTVEKNIDWGIKLSQTTSSCLVSASYPNAYPQQLANKQISGCNKQAGDIMLNAVTEDLGVVSCMHIYRLTILGENSQNNKIIIQTIEAIPDITPNCQPQNGLIIKPGRQSWRMVPTI
jgi:hypothetical protein